MSTTSQFIITLLLSGVIAAIVSAIMQKRNEKESRLFNAKLEAYKDLNLDSPLMGDSYRWEITQNIFEKFYACSRGGRGEEALGLLKQYGRWKPVE